MKKNEYRFAGGSFKYDFSGLEHLLNSAKERYVVRVGILGSKGNATHQRKEAGGVKKAGEHNTSKQLSSVTNAEIGLAHEKGVKSQNLPRRSWLVTPLEDHLGEYFQRLGAQALLHILKAQPRQAYVELGIVCEQIVLRGFETGGYGKWKALSPATIRRKKSSAILIDTAQLKKSVTSTVVSL